MKIAKKVLAVVLCTMMIASTMINEGWSSVLQSIRASAIAGHEQNYNDARVELDFNKGWKFAFSDDSASYLKGFDDSGWEDVDLPHDFSISQGFSATGTEAESGNIPGGTGWYRKWFNLYEYYTGDCITIDFDGAYQHAYVYVNGQYVGENHYGYNSFSIEISDYLICSNTALNLIAVKVVNDIPSSRWYSGSGINRDVKLTIKGPVHVSLYGPQVTTPNIASGDGTAKAEVTMNNDTSISKKVTVETTILDDNHNVVGETVTSSLVTVPAESEYTVTLEPKVASPKLWSIDTPNLYKLKTVIKNEAGELIDEYHTTFGYRYIKWDKDNGFSLNGELIKLKGVSLHHDQGALGAIQEYDAIYRQLSILKDMGCNAVRTTHNTTSRVLIDICNKLGILVMEEFFDGWDAEKNFNTNDFSVYFNETLKENNQLIGAKGQKWFEFVVEQTILRDRHDPCIIAWGVGNELSNLTEGESTANYENIVKAILNITDKLDPSRVVTQGNNKSHDPATMMVDGYMDITGANYSPADWAWLISQPDDFRSSKPFVATEAASSNNSRGVYYTMSKDDATHQCTAYDTYAVEWGEEAAEAWYYVATNDFFSGEFVWTGFDYIGETTPWMEWAGPNPNLVPNSSYFGIVDTAGFAKDSYYLYRSWWNEKDTTLHLVPGSWNDENLLLNNGYVNVAVYSNAKKIELLLNGNVIATATSAVTTTPAGYTYRTWTESITDSSKCSIGNFYTEAGANFYSQFSVKYEEGTLSVKAYDETGAEITDTVGSSKSVSGTAAQIHVNTWQNKNTYVADGGEYIYLEFEARDADGNFMNDYNGTLSFKVDDQSARYAKIVGVDNGNPATTEKFQQPSVLKSDSEAEFKMFNGKALVILKTTEEEGTINFTAIASDNGTSFSTEGVTVTSVSETGIRLTDEFEEVVIQNGDEYEVTLFDEYEMVKHHINELEAPVNTGGDSISSDKFVIYQPSASATQYIPNGNYAISANKVLMSSEVFDGWAVSKSTDISDIDWASGSTYPYDSFDTIDSNVFTFTHVGNNKYYIQNNITKDYLTRNTYMVVLGSEPHAFTVDLNDDGSLMIYSEDPYPNYYIAQGYDPFEFKPKESDSAKIWLYSAPKKASDDTTEEEPAVPEKYVLKLVDSTLPNGEYVLNISNTVMSDEVYATWAVAADTAVTGVEWASANDPYKYLSLNTSADNIYEFTNRGGNKYYIQNKHTGEYLCVNNYCLWLGEDPFEFTVNVNNNGSIEISYTAANGTTYPIFREWEYYGFEQPDQDYNTTIWLYEPQYPESEDGDDTGDSGNVSNNYVERKALYDALHEGIEYDYSEYTRASYEVLLEKLEEGVAIYKKADATNDELAAATAAIKAAIQGLKLDVKKIDGTLFKYGYNNSTGTADYSSGGILMNDIAVRQMKTAIYADENILNQIKDIIGYNDPSFGWTGTKADEALEKAVELYAEIYTMQFTGVPYTGSPDRNGVSNSSYLYKDTAITPLTAWNIWTKANTHGATDPVGIHDGVSLQGLASSTLDDGVITSHSAYTSELSYANDGPEEGDSTMYDIEYYTYGFETGSQYKEVTLEYLSGISVYFPDLFTKESLDVNGNVTEATSGQFSKYYWDTEFPMFISTDEYGVNTYHYDSKDTQYLIQASFNDAEHKVNMELNDVGKWWVNGPNNGNGSGFFPFNYKQGATSIEGENAVYHYGFTFEHNFYIPKGGKHVNGEDVIFNFSGDDDVYVYIDGVLVLDNGGLHGARAATINFTDCSINYQYAMDVTDGVLKGDEFETTYSYNTYLENPDGCGYNADTIAAINKLHEVIHDGEVHTLNFFYLERGASDSNCRISFNLSETSEEVKIIDQNLTLDYGLPVEYDITKNNIISQAAIDNGVKIEYLGICAVNLDYTPTYTFEKPNILIPFEDGVTYTVDGMKYGTCTVDNKGNVSYTLKSTNMKKSENFYVVAKITGDPTYAEEVVYYQVEKTTFIPATAIYYEDTFDTITYTDGKVATNYDNTANEYGLWKTDGKQATTLKQNADITDSEANPYGYETNYMSFADYSGGSIHYVDVSTKNNPSSKFSGGTGGKWPTVEFDFTGTGFDLISITDCTTGAFSVMVKDANNKTVRNHVIDTFYGYNYGRIFADANGQPSLNSTLTPMYKSESGACTTDERYYDENGKLTDVAHYYDTDGSVTEEVRYYDENGAVTDVAHYYGAEGKITETETDAPSYACSYAFAYGWVLAPEGSKDTLYQIPVIKIENLEYGSYSVVITPTFTSSFRHSSVAKDGTNYYRVYLDAIKIYSPAGTGDDIVDKDVKTAYSTDDELYPSYLELKSMLIGADSLSETDTQGIIFIDGIAALDNDIETYKSAGPNNELYLAKDQAVAFEIWATSVPTDVQLGAKLACGEPDLTISYASKTTDIDIKTATDIYYSLNTELPNDAKLTWRQVKGSDGNNYYTTGTVVIQNTGTADSVLSITNLKWTFSQNGGKGYFRIPTPVEDENVTVSSTTGTQAVAYSLMRMRTAALDVEQIGEPEVVTDENGNSVITLKLRTESEVTSLEVSDEKGRAINPKNIDYSSSPVDGEDTIEWTVTITTDEYGVHTYTVAGAYENGYTDYSKSITVTVTIEAPPVDDPTDDPTDKPTDDPTDDPTDKPTDDPTDKPTDDPTDNPTDEPTDNPTDEPADEPTDDKSCPFFEFIIWVYNQLVKLTKAVLSLLGIKI